jgi:hypothetical protein
MNGGLRASAKYLCSGPTPPQIRPGAGSTVTNQLVPRATDPGVGTDCEVEDIEHSEESEEGASEEEDVWSRCA